MKQEEIVFLVLLILISFLGIYTLSLFSQRVKPLKAEVLSLKQEMEVKEKYIQKIKETYENLSKNEIYSLIQTALPEKPDYSDILSFLSQKATAHGLALSSKISFSEKKKSETLPEIQPETQGTLTSPFSLKQLEISFSVIGNYNGFRGFLKDLEFSQRHFKVKKIEISPSKENFEIKMLTEVYHY
jgi:Tfp pilus assembly protein PilO